MKKVFRRMKACWLRFDHRGRTWRPVVVYSKEPHHCRYCGEDYQGNYCPQCGIKDEDTSLTSKHALLNVMDIWNVGNTTIFRTFFHLLWRPGYMIADWLKGFHSYYFPPVLTLATACLLFSLSFSFRNLQTEMGTALLADSFSEDPTSSIFQKAQTIDNVVHQIVQWKDDNLVINLILENAIVIFIGGFLFKKSPRMGKLGRVQLFFAQIYIVAQLYLLSSVYVLVMGKASTGASIFSKFPLILTFFILIFDYRQLFGYSLLKTIFKTLLLIFLTYFFMIFFIVATISLFILL